MRVNSCIEHWEYSEWTNKLIFCFQMISCFPTDHEWTDEGILCIIQQPRQSCGGSPVVVKPGTVILLCLIDVCECLCLFVCVFEIPKCILNCQYTHCMLRDQVLRSFNFLLTKRPWSDEETRVLWGHRQSCGGAPVVVKPGMVMLLYLIDMCACMCESSPYPRGLLPYIGYSIWVCAAGKGMVFKPFSLV